MPTAGAPRFDRLVHCDWSLHPDKRVMAIADRRAEGWHCHPTRALGGIEAFLALLADPHRCVLAGFDFPIGVPRAYAERAGIDDFPAALERFGEGAWSRFFDVCETADEISLHRPFYPKRSRAGVSPEHLRIAFGLADRDGLRRIPERGTKGGRGAACPLFWTLGANQVGKAALHGWCDVLRPARAAGATLWPFEGPLEQLAAPGRPVLAETYPAEAYAHLDCRFGRGQSKRRQADRAAAGGSLVARAGALGVGLDPKLAAAITDGFGERLDGEDQFDALAGLLLMIDVAEGRHPAGAPAPEDLAVEGWILGQAASP